MTSQVVTQVDGSTVAEPAGAAPAAITLPPGVDFEAAVKAPVFSGLTPEQVHEFLALGTPRSYQAGEMIIREDDTDTEMYLLLRGRLTITKKIPPLVPGGPEQQKELFQPAVPQMMGIFPFGEMNLLAGLGRSSSIVPLEDSEVLVITKAAFEGLCGRDARLGYVMTRNIAQNIARNLIQTNLRVAKLTTALTLALQKRG